jgi:tryptophanyl-tRNA synthetase
MGYQTFDHVVNHSYDTIENNTERWDAVCNEMERIAKSKKIHAMYVACKEDLLHNQQHFLATKRERLHEFGKQLHQLATS